MAHQAARAPAPDQGRSQEASCPIGQVGFPCPAVWLHAEIDGSGPALCLVHSGVTNLRMENYRAEKPEPTPRPLDPLAAERLGELQAPLLVMVGLRDEAATTHSGRFLAATTGAPLLEFDTAHMINLEQPAVVTRALLEFAASVYG